MHLKSSTILLIIPTLIYASMNVNVVVSSENDKKVIIEGNHSAIITDEDAKDLGLTDDALKKAVKDYFGATPTDVFLHSPTPWDDLYKTHNWPEVSRIITPIKATIVADDTHPIVVWNDTLYNDRDTCSLVRIDLEVAAQNFIESTWTTSFGVEASVGIDLNFDTDSGLSASLSISADLDISDSKTKNVTIRTKKIVLLPMSPHTGARSELASKQSRMKIQVDYEASLSGYAAINYYDTYKGHHFWAFDINDIMAASGLPTKKKSTQIIECGFFFSSETILKDIKTDKVLYAAPAAIYY